MFDAVGRVFFPNLTRFERRRNLRMLIAAATGLVALVLGVIWIVLTASDAGINVKSGTGRPAMLSDR